MSLSNILTIGVTGATGAASSNCRELYANSLHTNSLDVINLTTNSLTTQFLNVTESFYARMSASLQTITLGASPVVVNFDSLVISPLSGNYNTGTKTYTIPKAGNYRFDIGCDVAVGQTGIGVNSMVVSMFVVLNGVVIPALDLVTLQQVTQFDSSFPSYNQQPITSIYRPFNQGDQIQVQIAIAGVNTTGIALNQSAVLKAGSYFIGSSY